MLAFNGTRDDNRIGVQDRVLVSGGRDNTVRLWDLHSGNLIATLIGHDNWVREVAVSSKYIYSASDDRSIRCWDVVQGRTSHKIIDAHSHFVTSLRCHPQTPFLVSG